MIVHDPRNPTARRYRDELDARLPADFGGEELVVVAGGDGFLLQTVRHYGLDRTYLGLNAGHLGFLLNDVDDWDAVAAALRDGRWRAFSFPVLEAHIELDDGRVLRERAINDIYLERMTGQTARLHLVINDHPVVDRLVADGIVFATALGSTAYTFSAGGPACHPTLRVLAVTPICPHHPRLSPFALPDSAVAQVDVVMGDFRPVRAVADGTTHERVRSVRVRIDDQPVRLAYLDGHDFTSRMITKLLHP